MSWGASGTVEEGIFEFTPEPTLNSVEHEAQAEAAVEAAAALIDSGVLGHPDAKYRINLSGHANPHHAPVPGWSNDCVSINIIQISEEE